MKNKLTYHLLDAVYIMHAVFNDISIKAVFDHFERIMLKLDVCLCFLSSEMDLMTSTQRNCPVKLRYTFEVENCL
jgi:hypothetical protein